MSRQYGFIISLFIHAAILMVPVSMVLKDKIQEVELFVFVEEARNRLASVTTRREILQPVKKEKPKPEKVEKVVKLVEEPLPEKNTKVMTGQTVVDRNPTKEPTQQKTSEPLPEAMVASPPKTHSFKEPQEPLDTEFGSAMAPAFLHREIPEYPILARRLGKEGKVVLRLTIDEKGNLLDIEVLKKADCGFTEAAIEAVKKSTFLPAKKEGKPIASKAILPIRFTLRRD